jgi:hypothetical protein
MALSEPLFSPVAGEAPHSNSSSRWRGKGKYVLAFALIGVTIGTVGGTWWVSQTPPAPKKTGPPPCPAAPSHPPAGCFGSTCMKYERVVNVQPGYQWNDAGGYCGSWSSQRAFLSLGAWISQQQVRDHTTHCNSTAPNDGHDAEILSCNIDEAWTRLKIDYDAFDYRNTALPQATEYFKWLKKQLSAGRVVAWMIMWSGQQYPIYSLPPPAGMYGHVEPVVGIQSNHPLDDETVHDDDIVLHYTDNGLKTLHRNFSSLPGNWSGPGSRADCGAFSYCIGSPYGFGWAATGFTQDPKRAAAAPALLSVDPWQREPDTRNGSAHPDCLSCAPVPLQGTLSARELCAGAAYDIYRWDTVASAFTYSLLYKKVRFTATTENYTYVDDKSFQSDGTTYYRVVRAN